MKIFIVFFGIFVTTNLSYSQDCNFLDSTNSFHGIYFGGSISSSIKIVSEKLKGENTYIIESSLTNKYDKPYDILVFDKVRFKKIYIECDKNDKVFSFSLTKPLNRQDSSEMMKGEMPSSFSNLMDNIQSIFGHYSFDKFESDTITNVFGSSGIFTWECNKIRLIAKIKSGSKIPELNEITLTIENIEMKKRYQLSKLK